MKKSRVWLLFMSVGAILASGLAFAIWMANGIVYGSMVDLANRAQDLAVARERAVAALIAAILLQMVALFTTTSWLPRMGLTGVLGTSLRFAMAFAINMVGAGLALAMVVQVTRLVH